MEPKNNTHQQPFVLIVENNGILARQIHLLLTAAGFQVLSSASAAEALTIIKQRLPDVILSSITLGALSGYDLLRRLRADYRYEHLPVVLMPNRFDEADLLLALDLKVTDLLPKPFDAYDLVDVIHGALPTREPARKAS
jgi:CheY-like chemotaxis protein